MCRLILGTSDAAGLLWEALCLTHNNASLSGLRSWYISWTSCEPCFPLVMTRTFTRAKPLCPLRACTIHPACVAYAEPLAKQHQWWYKPKHTALDNTSSQHTKQCIMVHSSHAAPDSPSRDTRSFSAIMMAASCSTAACSSPSRFSTTARAHRACMSTSMAPVTFSCVKVELLQAIIQRVVYLCLGGYADCFTKYGPRTVMCPLICS